MNYTIASESEKVLRSGASGRGPVSNWRETVPDGLVHAVEPGAATTVCGLDLGALVAWPDLDYRVGMFQRCYPCRAVAWPDQPV